MAHLLDLDNLAIALGSRPILAGVNLSLQDGDHIGVVGPNGGGKSTLVKMLTGELRADSGRVTRAGFTRISYLHQQDNLPDTELAGRVIHPGKEVYEWASDPRIRRLHQGLLADVDLERPISTLSGGQRRRVDLAATLVKPAEVLVLDEPTNHLDIEGVTFLAHYLQQEFPPHKGALVVITHDRWFLDAVCSRIWEVIPGNDGVGGLNPQPGKVAEYEGGYAAYILQRAERARIERVQEEKRRNLLRKELAWLRRGAPARTAKPRFRVEAANELIAEEPPPRDSLELAKMATARLGKDVIDLLAVDFSWPESAQKVLSDVTLRLKPGERIGILGKNGAGKSSLLGLMNGTLQPQQGKVKIGQTVALATLSQHTRELAEVEQKRVLPAVEEVARVVRVGKRELKASQLLDMLGFTRERAWTPVAELSGGERRRLQLLRLLMQEPNVLLLDEPTNDLDTDTLTAVEDLLDSWPGTLVVVSHDRYLLERVTDRQIAVIDGAVRDLPGGVDQYLQLRAEQTEAENLPTAKSVAGEHKISEENKAAAANNTSEQLTSSEQERRARKAMARAERKMQKLQQEKTQLGAHQTQLALAGEYAELAEIGRQIAQLETELAEQEEAWLTAASWAEEVSGA